MLLNFLADEATWYPVLFDSPMNVLRAVAFWFTIAYMLAVVVCACVLRGERRTKLLKIALSAAVVLACILGILFLAFSFAEDGIVTILFVPLLVLLITVAGGATAICLRPKKSTLLVCGCISGAALVAFLICAGIHFSSGNAAGNNRILDDDGNPDNSKIDSVGLYISAVLAVAAVIAAAFLCGKNDRRGFDSKSITYAAICIAMSYALSYIRIVKMPQGGSITVASLLPLMIYAYMFGTKKGVFAGFIYGVLQALQDGYILHPAQFILDYPAAFACIGLAGMFAHTKAIEKLPQVQFALGGVVAGLARFLMHFLSGIFAFGSCAPAGQAIWLYSLTYQAAYVLPDIAIAIVAGVLVFSSPSFVKQARRFHKPLSTEVSDPETGSENEKIA